MPFVSSKQRKLCFAKMSSDKKAGRKITWDCHKFANEVKVGGRTRKIYKGPRGGKYYILNGVKKYIKTY